MRLDGELLNIIFTLATATTCNVHVFSAYCIWIAWTIANKCSKCSPSWSLGNSVRASWSSWRRSISGSTGTYKWCLFASFLFSSFIYFYVVQFQENIKCAKSNSRHAYSDTEPSINRSVILADDASSSRMEDRGYTSDNPQSHLSIIH